MDTVTHTVTVLLFLSLVYVLGVAVRGTVDDWLGGE